MKKFILLALLLTTFSAFGQQQFTLSGSIKDAATGEYLIGVRLRVLEQQGVGAVSNEYGFFSLSLPSGTYTIELSQFDYKTIQRTINLTANQQMDWSLETAITEVEEVVIKAKRDDDLIRNSQMGVEKLDMKEINKIPVIFGERDVIKTLQLLPGIKSGGDGNAGFFVRGGAADQNLILLDEAPVYNASHLLGFFSTFNSDAIKDVTIYKGGMPANYGGRLSSVLDVKMNDGNNKKFSLGGGLGIISSKLYVEGPLIKKEKGSFLVTARRTYLDQFLRFAQNESLKNSQLYFYDLNLKANYRINDKNRLFVSGYFGQDKLGFSDQFSINWGNATGTVRWNSILSPKLFSNTSLIFSNYNYKVSLSSASTTVDVTSKIRDYNVKQEFSYFLNTKNTIRFGINSIYHTITPGKVSSNDESTFNSTTFEDRYAWENAAFISNDWEATSRLKVNYGLRFTTFSNLGKGTFYSFDENGNEKGSTTYDKQNIINTYYNIEPRLSLSFITTEKSSIKAGYARNVQNLHLISNSTSTNPTDLWLASSFNVKPEISDQVSIGYFRTIGKQFEFSSEAYYKGLQNQIDYRDGANTQANDKIEGELLYGIGRAYGVELLLKKKAGKFTGWIGYTLSRTEKKIDGISNNEWYAARQDRTHDISIVGIYNLSDKWSFSATWVFYTGNAVTFPTGKYELEGQVQYVYTERNGYRMPNYHRLDFGATWYRKNTAKFESSWNFSVYNAYARENAYSITFRQNASNPAVTEAVQTALFRLVPSITYNFKFK
jgi:CarboxypepD_reg-like domain/TonB dependent receptor/TonB-dependent Receptor Plug Domain